MRLKIINDDGIFGARRNVCVEATSIKGIRPALRYRHDVGIVCRRRWDSRCHSYYESDK